jgi:hypothetical protein
MMALCLRVLFCFATLFGAVSSSAQFRCGNSFQDTPCATGSAASMPRSSVSGSKSAASPDVAVSQNVSPFAVVCARWGKTALDVAWKREAGALREAQLAKPGGDISRKDFTTVVDSVYAKRGTAPKLRVEVETECIAQKQLEADEAAVLAAMARKLGDSDKNQALDSANNDLQKKTPSRDGQAKTASQADRQDSCSDLKDKLFAVKNSARRGGSAATMEKLNDDRRELERKINNAKC